MLVISVENLTLEKLVANDSKIVMLNATAVPEDEPIDLYPIWLVIPFTVIYVIVFIFGIIGNVSTCVVIAKNKSLQTATNYYLFSLACSDLLLLVSGLTPEIIRIWSPDHYIFGQVCCILQGLTAETSAYATVLTITAFTVERYIAICHPFLTQTMSSLYRAVKFVIAIWIIAFIFAVPQALQFGIVEEETKYGMNTVHCTVKHQFFEHAFEISAFVIFVGPMTLITVLYILIGMQLRKSKSMDNCRNTSKRSSEKGGTTRNTNAQKRVVKMLIAVVAAFFICWAPFHAQRLLAVYLSTASTEIQNKFFYFYLYLMHTSGVLYFVSTTVNPVVYHIMSKKFRKAFKDTFLAVCHCTKNSAEYAAINKVPPSRRSMERSVSEGVPSDFLGSATRRPERHIASKGRSDSKVSNSSQGSYFSNISRANSLYERNKAIALENPHVGGKFLPARFYKIFGKQNANGNTENSNSISNSSLRDTEVTEFSYSDLIHNMKKINEDIH